MTWRTVEDLGIPLWAPSNPLNSKGRQMIVRAWFIVFGSGCPCCGRTMLHRGSGARAKRGCAWATIDHIVARGLGGGNEPTNLRVICWTCNHEKSIGESRMAEAAE